MLWSPFSIEAFKKMREREGEIERERERAKGAVGSMSTSVLNLIVSKRNSEDLYYAFIRSQDPAEPAHQVMNQS